MTVMEQKFYRAPWFPEQIKELGEWWPHFGTYYMATRLGLSRQQVKSKVDNLGLRLLPKSQRLCIDCQVGFQVNRRQGLLCRTCFSERRKRVRREQSRTLVQWITEATNTARHRSSIESDLTAEYMVDLWNKQGGRCYYSGLEMKQPCYGAGRDVYSPSIDRVDPKRGYVQGNVVWACWVCNAGKSEMSVREYLNLCSLVLRHTQNWACHGDVLSELADSNGTTEGN